MKLKIGKYYKNTELTCSVSDTCWKSDFCDTGVLTKECINCPYLVEITHNKKLLKESKRID